MLFLYGILMTFKHEFELKQDICAVGMNFKNISSTFLQ